MLNAQIKLTINNSVIPVKKEITYLGIQINEDNNYIENTLKKFGEVRTSYFSLYKYGIQPIGLNPITKARIYNSYCIPKFTYAIGLRNICPQLLRDIEVLQNNIIRGTLSLHKRTKMSSLKKVLKINQIKELYYKYKIITLNLMKRHNTTRAIYDQCGADLIKNSFTEEIMSISEELLEIQLPYDELIDISNDLKKLVKLREKETLIISTDNELEISKILQKYSYNQIRKLNKILTPNQQ